MNIPTISNWWFSIAGGFLLVGTLAYLSFDGILARFFLSHMDSSKRIERLQVDRVIETLQIQPGQRIADIGAGTGLFSFRIARKVGATGRVYAIDINPALVSHLTDAISENGLGQTIPILGEENDAKVPEPVDLIFFCDTLHHIKDKETYLQGLQRYLKPNGRIAVIDFKQKWSLFHSAKYSPEELNGWMTGAGYALEEAHDYLKSDFFVIYRRMG